MAEADINAIELSLFSSRIESVCDEMGVILQRAAFSPNIKDRLDFSCAVFDAQGLLVAQAAHIPVHLGSMAYAMHEVIARFTWQPGDMVVFNDPYLGGTHLPDVTLVAPVFVADACCGFVANRAHHANIGASAPGSMPLSRQLQEEGIVIAPCKLLQQGQLDEAVMGRLLGQEGVSVASAAAVAVGRGDFLAQIAANRIGAERLASLVDDYALSGYQSAIDALQAYAERIARGVLAEIPAGRYCFTDFLDDDGYGQQDIPIQVNLTVNEQGCEVDFSGTAVQVVGNLNCPLSVAAAAVYYAFRCLMPSYTPCCAGAFRPISLRAEPGLLVNACYPAAVAAGNVETSTRIVDALLGALAQALPDQIPAASHGSMNNVAMGQVDPDTGARWDYYETLGGGMGAGPRCDGSHAVQTHMTNTLNTPVETLEAHYPLRVLRYAVRGGSGGNGYHQGGNGLVREYQFLAPAQVTLLSERRRTVPWGLVGGAPGQAGCNQLNDVDLPGKVAIHVNQGDRLCIATPGGGGWHATDWSGSKRGSL